MPEAATIDLALPHFEVYPRRRLVQIVEFNIFPTPRSKGGLEAVHESHSGSPFSPEDGLRRDNRQPAAAQGSLARACHAPGEYLPAPRGRFDDAELL
jgi:hypothetical protein